MCVVVQVSRSTSLLATEKAGNKDAYNRYLSRVYTLLSKGPMQNIFTCSSGFSTQRCMNVRKSKKSPTEIVQRTMDDSTLYTDRANPQRKCIAFDLAEVCFVFYTFLRA